MQNSYWYLVQASGIGHSYILFPTFKLAKFKELAEVSNEFSSKLTEKYCSKKLKYFVSRRRKIL